MKSKLFPERNVALDTKVVPVVLSVGRGVISSVVDPLFVNKIYKDMAAGEDNYQEFACDLAGIGSYISAISFIGYLIVLNPLNPLSYIPLATNAISAVVQHKKD